MHLDDGNMVKSGMRSAELSATADTYTEYLLPKKQMKTMTYTMTSEDSMTTGKDCGLNKVRDFNNRFDNDVSTDYITSSHDLHDMIILDNMCHGTEAEYGLQDTARV